MPSATMLRAVVLEPLDMQMQTERPINTAKSTIIYYTKPSRDLNQSSSPLVIRLYKMCFAYGVLLAAMHVHLTVI